MVTDWFIYTMPVLLNAHSYTDIGQNGAVINKVVTDSSKFLKKIPLFRPWKVFGNQTQFLKFRNLMSKWLESHWISVFLNHHNHCVKIFYMMSEMRNVTWVWKWKWVWKKYSKVFDIFCPKLWPPWIKRLWLLHIK